MEEYDQVATGFDLGYVIVEFRRKRKVVMTLSIHVGPADHDYPLVLEKGEDLSKFLDAHVTSVSLDMPNGVTPSDLSRFPWTRWLNFAEDVARTGNVPKVLNDTSKSRPVREVLGFAVEPAPTGRKGYPRSHYEKIARLYLKLRAQGSANPTKAIADELDYNRNTVAGWIRRCRELDLLPPARHGRAG